MSNQAIATDISDFASLLVEHKLLEDATSLYSASSKLYNSIVMTDWKYECINLQFSDITETVAGTIPQQLGLVRIVLSIIVNGNFSNGGNVISNPLSKLKFDIELEGWNTNAELFYASWHLDKHDTGGNTSTYIHPEYHLTFGGNKLEEKGVDNFGAALILPSPRIAYPPMDVILGIDFILQNYFPLDRISNLLNNSKYKQIVSNSQERLWKSYYLSISSKWNSIPNLTFSQGFQHFNLNPHINQ